MPVQTLATPGEPHRYQFSLSNSSDTCQIYLFGATITSWRVNGEEKLFLSSKSLLDGTKAIRGGIPLVFPQFAVPTVPHCAQLLPQHGFARDNHWKWLGTTVDDGEIVTGSFLLDDPILPKDTKALWPFKFQLTYTVTLKAGSLTTCLSAKNTDQKEWKFTSLLHNYFLVPSIETTRVHGLKGFSFYDKTDEKKKKQENRDSIHMDSEVDRIYENVTTRDLILDTGNASTKAGIKITNDNFRDVVTWNPWVEKAKAMRDMADDEYKNMICVELGTVVEPITLRPGETWKAGQILTAI